MEDLPEYDKWKTHEPSEPYENHPEEWFCIKCGGAIEELFNCCSIPGICKCPPVRVCECPEPDPEDSPSGDVSEEG